MGWAGNEDSMAVLEDVGSGLYPDRSGARRRGGRPGCAERISAAYTVRVWEVSLHAEVEDWFLAICVSDPVTADLIAEAIDVLAEHGPALGRPLVDRLHHSKYHHMKELRPPSTGGTEVRLIFAFDPTREAIFLVAGDKAAQWNAWYRTAIPLADERYEQHLANLQEQDEKEEKS